MATLRCLLPKVRLAHLVKGILLCAFLLLALFFCYNNNSFQPTKPLIAITNVPSDVSKDNQSKVSATFDLVRYGLAQMTFDNASVDRNETGYEEFIVPDIVHYIQLDNPQLKFVTLISILSVVRHHKPRLLLVHSNCKMLSGKYWDQVVALNRMQSHTMIEFRRIQRPKTIFGRELSQVFHAGDIARVLVMRKYGGIYLDSDVYVVKSMHQFRKFEFAIGWPDFAYPDGFLGNQVLIGHRNARFLKLYFESYREYGPNEWYFNAGQLPTTSILEPMPYLVHRVRLCFGVHDLRSMLYDDLDANWQRDFYAVHLLSRHQSDGRDDGIESFDEMTIRSYNRTFGEMARLVYYGSKDLLKP